MNHPLAVRLLAEVAGTGCLVGIGVGAIVAGGSGVGPWVLPVAWFVAVTIPILLFASISGAHLNPAVTLSLVLARRFPAREALAYVVAELAGAVGGAWAVVRLLGSGHDLGATTLSGISPLVGVSLEALFTFLLALAVLTIVELQPHIGRWALLLPGAVVGLSTWLIGPITGSSLNPARTIGPALWLGEWGGLLPYLLGPAIGAVLAIPVAALLRRHGFPASITA